MVPKLRQDESANGGSGGGLDYPPTGLRRIVFLLAMAALNACGGNAEKAESVSTGVEFKNPIRNENVNCLVSLMKAACKNASVPEEFANESCAGKFGNLNVDELGTELERELETGGFFGRMVVGSCHGSTGGAEPDTDSQRFDVGVDCDAVSKAGDRVTLLSGANCIN